MIGIWKERRSLRIRLAEAETELKLAAMLIESLYADIADWDRALHAEIADRKRALHAGIAEEKRARVALAQLLESERERNKDLFQQGVDQAFRIHDLERQLREDARVSPSQVQHTLGIA